MGPNHGVTFIDSTVEYVGPNNIQLNKSKYPQDVVLVFPYVSGSIFGNPDSVPLFVQKVDKSMGFRLNLSEKLDQIENNITPLSAEWRGLGLNVAPSDTRIGRLGTLPYSETTREAIGGGGFIDPSTRETLILVYVDKACTVIGKVAIGKELYSHNLEFPGRGFHWVRIVERSHKSYSLEIHNGNQANFSIHILNLKAL
jgi:hypothetical protein